MCSIILGGDDTSSPFSPTTELTATWRENSARATLTSPPVPEASDSLCASALPP